MRHEYHSANLIARPTLIYNSYRLNIFGFPGNPDGPQNLGLLDQRLAIEWTRENIAFFGGDKDRMILFGQSAGGESIDYYSFAYPDDPIVTGFILQSGTVFTELPKPIEQASISWYNATAELGCGTANTPSEAILACMRSKPYSEIEPLVANGLTPSAGAAGSFGVVIDNRTIFGDYVTRAQAGKFAKIPLFIGNNDYESGNFKTIIAITPKVISKGLLPSDAMFNVLDYVGFNCPIALRAYCSQHAHVPTYRYRFFGDFPNLALTTSPPSGAYHAAEDRLLFNQLDDLAPSTPAELTIAKFMRDSWAAFAKDPEAGLQRQELGWESYNPAKKTMARLGLRNITGANNGVPADYDYSCPFFAALFGASGPPPDLMLGNEMQYERLGNLSRAGAEDYLGVYET